MFCYNCECWRADLAQLVEQLICNQQVAGSSPIVGSIFLYFTEGFPSGQRGQTVNLLSTTSMVRIHLPPPEKVIDFTVDHFFQLFMKVCILLFQKSLVSHYSYPGSKRYLQREVDF
jgi:hypothetical protein